MFNIYQLIIAEILVPNILHISDRHDTNDISAEMKTLAQNTVDINVIAIYSNV